MQSQQLRIFLDVAELGSIARAAEKNFMTPQGLSYALTRLEKDLGYPLFVRGKNSLRLSPQGSAFVEYAKKLLETEDEARRTLAGMTLGLGVNDASYIGYCTEGLLVSAPLFPFGDLPDGLLEKTRFHSLPNESIADMLCDQPDSSKQRFAALIMAEVFDEQNNEIIARLHEAGYEYRRFVSYYDVLVVSSSSPLANMERVAYSDLVNQTFAITHGIISSIVENLFKPGEIGIICGDSGACMQLVRSGRAVTLRPAFSVHDEIADGIASVRLANPCRMEIGLVAKPELYAHEGFSVLAETLANWHDAFSDDSGM